MRKRKVADEAELKHRLYLRVNDKKYRELWTLLKKSEHQDMSSLLRDIISNRPVKVFTRDETLDNVMGELARLRTEIRAIGININQITRHFNTWPEPQKKAFYARVAFKEYQAIEVKVEDLLGIVSKLAKRWLSG